MILPNDVTIHPNGTLIVSDRYNHGILAVSRSGAMSVYAGGTGPGLTDGNRLARAKFNLPGGMTFDSNGTILYVTDTVNNRICRIASNGTVSVLTCGSVARFSSPNGITIFEKILYVCDTNNNMIRDIFLNGTTFPVAGNGTASSIDGHGQQATFNLPLGITNNDMVDLYVTEQPAIRIISRNKTTTTLTGSTSQGYVNGQGRAARFNGPTGIVFSSNGDILVAENYNNAIRRIKPTGNVSLLVGANGAGFLDGTLSFAQLNRPNGIAIDASDTIHIRL
jgi:DNA-binding beta-propeller fold protein YncE